MSEHVTILPISGAGCFSQMGILSRMVELGHTSEMLLGASGGNIAAYISHAADFDPQTMIDITHELRPEMFCTQWVPSSKFISTYCGYSKGSLYNYGTDNTDFLSRHYRDTDMYSREIWSAAYDIDSQRTRLFCNKEKDQSLLKPHTLDSNIYQIEESIYAGGDMSKISKIILASASIPLMVPPQVIDGCRMQDAGLSCASPMTLMAPLFRGKSNLHMYYINSEDIDITDCMIAVGGENKGMLSGLNSARGAMLKNITANDRRACYELVLRGEDSHKHKISDLKLDEEGWDELLRLEDEYDRTLVEIYPNKPTAMDLTSFTCDQISDEISRVLESSTMRVWCC